MVTDSTCMSPSIRNVTTDQLRSLFFLTTNQEREQSLVLARGRPFGLPRGFRPRLVVSAKQKHQKAPEFSDLAPLKPEAPKPGRAGTPRRKASSGNSAVSRADTGSVAESFRQDLREAVNRAVVLERKVSRESSAAVRPGGSAAERSGASGASRAQMEDEARELGVVIDWNKFSTYGTDFQQPGPKNYVPDTFAKETKIRVQKSTVPFVDPRRMPVQSVTQAALAEAQSRARMHYNRHGVPVLVGKGGKKGRERYPYPSDGAEFEPVTMYRQDMQGEQSERRVPFTPRNIPGQPVISMSEILLDPERYADLPHVSALAHRSVPFAAMA